jgi:serine protease Do
VRKISFIITLLLFISFVSACQQEPSKFEVTFDSSGGSIIENMMVEKNEPFLPTEMPKKEGYIFSGWYIDSSTIYPFSFHNGINSNITLHAKWVKDQNELTTDDVSLILNQYLLSDLEKYLNEEMIATLFEKQMTKAIQKAKESVVMINTYRFNKIDGGGSGVIYKKVDQTYYILTNEHVIDGYTSSNVEIIIFHGNDEIKIPRGSVIIRKKSYANDMAVLTFTYQGELTPIEFGDVEQLKVGQIVFSIGSPLDLPNSTSMGIISFYNRPMIDDINNTITIQHTASINPGNSGGALVDIFGRFIGLNFMSYVDPESGFEGLHFAIQINRILEILPTLE